MIKWVVEKSHNFLKEMVIESSGIAIWAGLPDANLKLIIGTLCSFPYSLWTRSVTGYSESEAWNDIRCIFKIIILSKKW